MPQASRACAAAIVCDSIVDSRASIQTLLCAKRTASISAPTSVTFGICW
jgi:hypothetical protein